jgi:GH24 family phage-related lysozyme (muramidase)
MTDLLPLLDKAPELVIFLGMLAISWRSLGIAHDLAKTVLQSGGIVRQPAPATAPAPATPHPEDAPAVHTAPPSISTQPVDVVDQGLVNFIKKEEGFTAKAKWDYKQYSIGYGTKANSATEVITEPEAAARLTVEIDAAWQLVKKIIPAGAPVGVEQALTDLTYNAGSGWEAAGLGTAVKASDWAKAKESILQYNHAGGQVIAGLTARREAEVSWFDNPL